MGGHYSLIKRIKGFFASRRKENYPKAFPGDTYIADLCRASKTRKPWVSIIVFIIALSLFADYWLLADAFDMAFQSGFWITYFVPIALLASYLCMGYLAGKKIIEFKSLRRKPALITAVIFTVFEIIVLVALFIIRCYGEVQRSGGMGDGGLGFSFGSTGTLSLGKASPSNGLSAFADKVADLGVDVLFPAIALSLIMFIGALLEMYYAYCTYDAYAGEKKRLAESHIAEDRLLYEKVYFDIVSSPEKNLEYERRERELDRKALECAFKVNKLSTQLNSIVDPADAYDFTSISRSINHSVARSER